MKDQNQFQHKLYNHSIPVREDVWKNVEANLPSKRKRLPFFWLSLAGFLFLGAAGVGLTVMHKPLTLNESNSSQTIPQFNPPVKSTPTPSQIAEANSSIKEMDASQAPPYNPILKNQSGHLHRKSIMTNQSTHSFSSTQNAVDFTLTKNAYQTEFHVVNPLAKLDFSQLSRDVKTIKINARPDPSCYKFRGKNGNNALSVDVFASPGVAPRSFEKTEGGTSPYAEARETTEESQYAWGAGARVNLNLKQGFAVRLGILYEQIGDKFNYTDASATQSTTRIDSFFAADGTFLRADTNRVLIFGTLIKKIHNRYTHLDIPLLLSYELPMGRCVLMINAGPVLNLTSSQRGQILDSTLKPVHITQGEPDELMAYKNSLGLSIYLGAGALIPLTDNISALIEPRILYRINPVTVDTYPLKEHRSFAGLNLGIRYHFN